ncbi:MAG: radical SAM protein, partial [Acidobacteria bacterium]
MLPVTSIPPARQGFHVIAKPTGALCNLACSYCFYTEKEGLYPGTESWAMPDSVLESFVRQYLAAQDIPTVSFSWQGGEPTLLGIEFFKKVVALQRRYANGKRIENAFQTNGVLLDDRWGEFLATNGFLVGLSIDGPEELHDRYRVDRGGHPTFRSVMRGLEVLRRHGAEFNTLTVITHANADHPVDVYRFLLEHGSRYLQFIPVVERSRQPGPHGEANLADPGSPGGEEIVTPWSVAPGQFGGFLCGVFDEWVRHDVGQVFVQMFDAAL